MRSFVPLLALLVEYEWQVEDVLAGKRPPNDIDAELRAELAALELTAEEAEEVGMMASAQTQLPEAPLVAWLGGESWR